MTMLGLHTIAETNALLADVDHRFTVVDKTFQDTLATHPTETAKLKPSWDSLKSRWASDKLAVRAKMGLIKGVTPGGNIMGDDKIPSDDEYKTILGYVEGDTGDPNFHPNDSIRGIELQLQSVIGHPIDVDTGRPSLNPNNPPPNDPDENFLKNKTVENLANAGQGVADVAAAAAKAAGAPGDHTLRNVGIGAGIGVIVLAILKVLL